MLGFRRGIAGFVILFILSANQTAWASFRTWDISEIYTNADGTVQYIELVNNASDFQDEFDGVTLTSNSSSYTFVGDLSVGDSTANLRLVIGTAGYVAAGGSVTSDYANLPDSFINPLGDTINFGSVDEVTFANAPINGNDSLHFTGNNGSGLSIETNSPTNLNGEVGQLAAKPPSAMLALLAAGALAPLLWSRSRRYTNRLVR